MPSVVSNSKKEFYPILKKYSHMKIYKIAQQRIQISHNDLVKIIEKQDAQELQNHIYKFLTTNAGWEERAAKLSPEIKKAYDDVTMANDWISGSSNIRWTQKNIQKGLPQNTPDDKLYFTPTDESLPNFIKTIDDLATYLTPVAQKWKRNLDYKINPTATGYMGENDRIVVHFGNKDASSDVNQAVSQWASQSGIQMGSRTHSRGQDTKGSSWGDNVAKHMATYAMQHMSSGKYTSDQVAKWIESYIGQVLSQMDRQNK